MRIKFNNILKVGVLSLYAPTINRNEKNHEIRENFYTKLDDILRKISNRHIIIIAGNFNARTGNAAKNKI